MERLRKLIKAVNDSRGQLLIESLIALGLSAIILPALLTGFVSSREGKSQQIQRAAAIGHLKGLEEIVRSVREKNWSSFAVNGVYHPQVSGNSWSFISAADTVDGFTRSITLSDVYRDANGVVVTTGGTIDTSTKKVDIKVTWEQPYNSSVSSIMFVTRFLQNTANTQTSSTDFNAGTLSNTQVTDSSGGEIALGPNTKGKWCSPSFSSSSISLPDGPPVAVAATASSTLSTPNDIFVATAPTNATSTKLAYITVPQNVDPPNPSTKGTFTLDATKYSSAGLVPTGINLDNSFQTNDLKFYKSAGGKTYALIATTKTDREVIAILVDDGDPANDSTNNGEFQDYVNHIYKYWTYFNTTIYDTTGNYDTGFTDPTANSSDSGGDGDGFATNPTRAYTDNNSFAVDTNSGSGTGTSCTGSDKDRHRFYNYGFSIPSGAAINGIEVRLDAKVDSTSGSPQMCVQLSWDGGTTWTTVKSTSTLTTSGATYTLGGGADTWGRSWDDTNFSNTNFRVRVINVASNISRDFSLDWAAVKIYYSGTPATTNDQAPYGAGASSIAVLSDRGYVTSGGFLYAFDLSNIDSKSTGNGLDMVGCRIEIDGYDCDVSTSRIRKYAAGSTGTNFGSEQNWLNACQDGGNTEIYADNDIYPVQVGANAYVYVAVGGGTNPEFEIVNVTSVPTASSSPVISNSACGTIASGNSGWKRISSLDFNSETNTQEAANSVYATTDGTRAYISSNGGIDANNDGDPDSWQFYILNTSNKNSPAFLSGTPSTGATSGYYNGAGSLGELYPRNSLTVFSGSRALLVGKDGVTNGSDAQEYQTLDITSEATPAYCGGVNYNQGFNDLASLTEADNDKFVYMVSKTGANELKIVQGGPDGTYLDSGTYTSTPVNLGTTSALNRLSTNTSLPANTSLTFQVAGTAPVAGSCNNATYVYVGPDGSTSTYFPSSGGQIPMSGTPGFENPAQCVAYKAFLTTTNYDVTPTLLDASINYSP